MSATRFDPCYNRDKGCKNKAINLVTTPGQEHTLPLCQGCTNKIVDFVGVHAKHLIIKQIPNFQN